MLAFALAVALLPATLDAFVRLLLWWYARRWRFAPQGSEVIRRWVVIVPARAEGEAVHATLRSALARSGTSNSLVVLLLDGADTRAAAAAPAGVRVLVKPNGGPTKAAALAWAGEALREEILQAEAVLLVDVGSRLDTGFFERFAWPVGADAVQAFLAGKGGSVGAAAALSERLAQHREDQGRERLGWRVRLRGTGTAMRPQVFLQVVGRLRSAVEDFELSMLLAADGYRLRLGPPSSMVVDDKPATVGAAARQRARWFAGRLSLLALQPLAWLQLLRRSPLEGVAFFLEIFGRPLTLSVPARLVVGLALLGWSAPPVGVALGTVTLASAVLDVVWGLRGMRRDSWGAVFKLAAAWVAALALLPRALFGWTRVRPRR